MKILIAIVFLLSQISCVKKKEVDKKSDFVYQKQGVSQSGKWKSGFEMIFVKGGEFIMGGNDKVEDGGAPELRIADECPHPVTLDSYYMGKYEVTQADWIEIMGTNPNKEEKCQDCPVSQVSWEDVQIFIKKLNLKYSETFHLPTEEKWEFAAKGGLKSNGFVYSGSNNVNEVAWYSDNSGNKPHSVGLLKPNELGIYDMSGNIREWCSNSKRPYPCDTVNKELKFESKILRGGTFAHTPQSIRVIDRNGRGTTLKLPTLGFRLAR